MRSMSLCFWADITLLNILEIAVPKGEKEAGEAQKNMKNYWQSNFQFDANYKSTDPRCSTNPTEKNVKKSQFFKKQHL